MEPTSSSPASPQDRGPWTVETYEFLKEVYEQTWLHYRHLVAQRTTYLGYLFTASFGTVGVGVPLIVSAERLSPSAEIATLAALLAVYQGFCLFVFASVRRSGLVMARYQRGLRILRERWAESLDQAANGARVPGLVELAEDAMDPKSAQVSRGLGLHEVVLLAPMGLLFLGAAGASGLFVVSLNEAGIAFAFLSGTLAAMCWLVAIWTVPVFLRDGDLDQLQASIASAPGD